MSHNLKYIIITLAIFGSLGGVVYYSITKQANPDEKLPTLSMGKSEESDTPKISPLDASQTQLQDSTQKPLTSNQKSSMYIATIQTSLGDIQFEMFTNDAPKTVENFVKLAQKKFYDGIIFHRVIKGFMIQGGDPTGTGTGGPGYKFEDELNPTTDSYRNGYKKGVVAMANSGPNTNGSQFFIMLADTPLPHNYTIFGRVIKGQEIVDAIGNVKTNQNDKPLTDVVMKNVTVSAR